MWISFRSQTADSLLGHGQIKSRGIVSSLKVVIISGLLTLWDKCAIFGLNVQKMGLFEESADKEITKGFSSIIRESTAPYLSKHKISLHRLSQLLEDKLLLSLVIKAGLPYSMFDLIQQRTPFSESDWSDFLGLSIKSLQRYKREKRAFKPLQTEKILELTEVTLLGLDVFDNLDKFKLWLITPSFALGSMEPISLLSDSYGKDLVMSELVRIDHGVFV